MAKDLRKRKPSETSSDHKNRFRSWRHHICRSLTKQNRLLPLHISRISSKVTSGIQCRGRQGPWDTVESAENTLKPKREGDAGHT